MSRLLGIDATKSTVRVAIIRAVYRRVTLEAFGEADVGWAGSEVDAIRAAVGGLRPDGCAIALSGEKSFYRRIELPAAAQREIDNVLAFELEATVPFEMEEAVFDYRTMRPTSPETIPVFAALARIEDVKSRIAPVREALGIEPERVGTGPLPLANLVTVMPELERPAIPGPIAILDVGDNATEVVILLNGDPVFARTLSRGTHGLPESARALARELRQTHAAWRAQGGDPLTCVYLSGFGASAQGADYFLSTELGLSVLPLPEPRIEGLTAEQKAQLPRFAKALGLALGLSAGRAKAMNLRQGALEAQRSYPFLREKIPLISGLAAVIAVSFGFSTIAEMRALDAERETQLARLSAATREVLGEEITEPEKVKEAIEGTTAKVDEDPLPHVDAFDVMVQLSKAVPKDVVHDVLELDVQRGKVIVQGVVKTVGDAETITKNMAEHRCFKDVKKAGTSQFTGEKQKYKLEFELKCEPPKKKAATPEPDGSASASATAKPEKETGR